nr:hypothetical protein [Tanacetum cinerariifolium]
MIISRVEIPKRQEQSHRYVSFALTEVQQSGAEVEEDDRKRARFLDGKISLGRKKSQESSDGGNIRDKDKTVGGAIGTCGGISDSLLVALYACITFIFGSSWKGEMASEAKRYLDKSSEGLEEVFPGASTQRCCGSLYPKMLWKPHGKWRTHTTTRYKGKEIAKPITPLSETASEEDFDPEQAQRDKDMQKNLALIAKYFKKIYKPTNNNLRTSSNSRNKNVDTTPQYKNDNQSGQLRNQRTENVVVAKENVGSLVVQQSGI